MTCDEERMEYWERERVRAELEDKVCSWLAKWAVLAATAVTSAIFLVAAAVSANNVLGSWFSPDEFGFALFVLILSGVFCAPLAARVIFSFVVEREMKRRVYDSNRRRV